MYFKHTGLKINQINAPPFQIRKPVISAGHFFVKIHQTRKQTALNTFQMHSGKQILLLSLTQTTHYQVSLKLKGVTMVKLKAHSRDSRACQ